MAVSTSTRETVRYYYGCLKFELNRSKYVSKCQLPQSIESVQRISSLSISPHPSGLVYAYYVPLGQRPLMLSHGYWALPVDSLFSRVAHIDPPRHVNRAALSFQRLARGPSPCCVGRANHGTKFRIITALYENSNTGVLSSS